MSSAWYAENKYTDRLLDLVLRFDIFDLDPVDIDDAPSHPDPPAEPVRRRFIDKTQPPAQPVGVAQDRSASTGFDGAVVEPGGMGAG